MGKVKGYVEKIIFRNPENGYTVLSLEENGCETVCVGVFNFVDEGEYLELEGEFVFHYSYGEQFKVYSYISRDPDDITSIERYLGSGAIKGIGPATAKRIINKFGEDALKVLDEEPELLATVKGISLRKAQEIAADREEKKDLRAALIFLGNYGISNVLAVKIYNQYGGALYSIMRQNPYQLADDISGIGFKKADQIAIRSGIDPGSDFRIKSGIIYCLMNAANEGNVFLPESILKDETLKTLKPATVDDFCEIEDADLRRCIEDLSVEKRIIIRDGEEDREIYYSSYYYTELGIARMLRDINLPGRVSIEKIEPKIEAIEQDTKISLDPLQREAIIQAVNSGVLVITGGPGTGKTTTINALIKYFEQDYKEILLAAPTGRAAKRMTEATGYEARTIHRMLELSGEIEDSAPGANFGRNEENPLEADVIIIDEMSMVDIFLMNALLKAIRVGTRLILVGDSNQLPSVGAGNVLRDIIESGVFNVVSLTKIFRQEEAGDIVLNAHKINAGELIDLRPDSKDFIFIKRENPNAILGALLTLVKDKMPKYVNAKIRDIQVLVPGKKGSLGVKNINTFLQQMLNPPSKEKRELETGDTLFREGDKVMHIKNNYDLRWELRTSSGYVYENGTGIFNGDIGIIQKINEYTHVTEVLFDDGKYVIYEFSQMEELALSYAITIHKSQGSEYPAVILPLLTGPAPLMNRNILYTAVTRARKCVCIVGSKDTVNHMIKNEREQKRYSGLSRDIKELKGKI